MIFVIRDQNSDSILDGYAVNSAGIKQIIHNSLHYQYEDYDRIEVDLQARVAAVKYKFLTTIYFDIILLEQVTIEDD